MAGRPTDFREKYIEEAYKLCLLGATDKEIADFFDVNPDTIYEWKKVYPEFSESIKKGKEVADCHLAHKLLNRAEGAEWTEETAFKVKKIEYGEDGRKVSETEEVITVPIKKAAPPDTTALIFWLKNRKSSKWRDRQEQEVTHKFEPLVVNVNGGSEPPP